MENMQNNSTANLSSSHWYDRYYWLLFLIPFLLLISSIIYIGSVYAKTGDVMYKDVTLTGGTTLTLIGSDFKATEMEQKLQQTYPGKYSDILIRSLVDIQTGKQTAITIETKADSTELITDVESMLNIKLDEKNSSVEFTGSFLSKSFYLDLIKALIIAFLFMSITVFIIFKVPIPSLAVIFAAFTDITVTLAVVDLLGLRVSTAGIAAFLMLIGYSVDTDILLTTRVLKRRETGPLNSRMVSAMKTGLTMTLTGIAAMLTAYLIFQSPTLKQVFLIILIGLVVDMLATWLGNTGILKWYCKKKNIQ